MNKKIIVVILLLCAMLSMGCIEEPLDTPASVFVEEQYDDEKYLDFCITSCELLRIDMEGAALSAEYGDFEELEMWGMYLKEDSKEVLNGVKKFKVSPALQPSKVEFELAIENLYLAGKYTESGARDSNVNDLDLAIYYINKYSVHIDKTMLLLPDSL